MSWLELGRKCCHFFGIVRTGFCIAFHCPSNVVENIEHEFDAFIKKLWSLPVQTVVDMLLAVNSLNTWKHVPHELPFSGCQFKFSTDPCSFHTSSSLVAQLLDGSAFETAPLNVESENT